MARNKNTLYFRDYYSLQVVLWVFCTYDHRHKKTITAGGGSSESSYWKKNEKSIALFWFPKIWTLKKLSTKQLLPKSSIIDD